MPSCPAKCKAVCTSVEGMDAAAMGLTKLHIACYKMDLAAVKSALRKGGPDGDPKALAKLEGVGEDVTPMMMCLQGAVRLYT